MAHSRFLLLLIGALSTRFPEAGAGAVDFWCNPEVRGKWMENAEEMIKKMRDCQGGSDVQATPIQCPYVGMNYRRWQNLTVLLRFADIMRDLQVLHDGLEEANNQTAVTCQTQLEDIKRHIRNNRVILQRKIQNVTVEASSPLQTCASLAEVLGRYQKLLQGKMELFVNSYEDKNCDEATTEFTDNR